MSKNSNDMKSSLVDSMDFVQDNSLGNTGNVSVSPGKDSFSAALEEFKKTPAWEQMLDSWLAEAMMTGKSLDATPFFGSLMKSVLEKGLQAEMTSHLGYEKGDKDSSLFADSRNGVSSKTVKTIVGDVTLDIPRDREGSFNPQLVPKHARHVGGLDDMIISLYAGGMTIRDIQHHLTSTISVQLSHDTISQVCDAVLEEVKAWQYRPLDPIYPIMIIDALVVKIRDNGHVKNKAAQLVIGVDLEGIKHVLGIWITQNEGAKYWVNIFTQIANRGVKDALIICSDGLAGIEDAIHTVWPTSTIQTCVVHLIRSALRFVPYKDKRAVARELKPIYTASDAEHARIELETFQNSDLGLKYPQTGAVFERNWEKFIPFLAFGAATRKMIYTTNAIESLNYQIRKVIKAKGHFPSDEAAVKMIWLALITIEDKKNRKREKQKGTTMKTSTLIEGHKTPDWAHILGELMTAYPETLEKYLQP